MIVSEYLKYISLKRKKVSFGLIVAEISAHGCLALVLWVVGARNIVVGVFGCGALFILRQLGSKERRKVARVSTFKRVLVA